jgi:hypothetical protein
VTQSGTSAEFLTAEFLVHSKGTLTRSDVIGIGSAIFKYLDIISLVCKEILGSAVEQCVILWFCHSVT